MITVAASDSLAASKLKADLVCSGSNDDQRIQDVVASLPLGGDMVSLLEGHFQWGLNASLVPIAGLRLVGQAYGHATSIIGAQSTTAPLINNPNGVPNVTLQRLSLYGHSALSGSKGVHATTASGWALRDIFADTFGDQGIHIEAGVACDFERVTVQNACLVRAGRTNWVGAFDIAVTDAYVFKVEATCSVQPSDGIGWLAGLRIAGTNSWVVASVGETSHVGVVQDWPAREITWLGVRGDLNNGPGFVANGDMSDYIGCRSFRNSRAGDGLASGFVINGRYFQFDDCRADDLGADTIQMKDGFEDHGGPNTYGINEANYIRGSKYNILGSSGARIVMPQKVAAGRWN